MKNIKVFQNTAVLEVEGMQPEIDVALWLNGKQFCEGVHALCDITEGCFFKICQSGQKPKFCKQRKDFSCALCDAAHSLSEISKRQIDWNLLCCCVSSNSTCLQPADKIFCLLNQIWGSHRWGCSRAGGERLPSLTHSLHPPSFSLHTGRPVADVEISLSFSLTLSLSPSPSHALLHLSLKQLSLLQVCAVGLEVGGCSFCFVLFCPPDPNLFFFSPSLFFILCNTSAAAPWLSK